MNFSNPLFSIVIPTYNSEKTIGHCLESVLSQTYTDYEILIIDGLSIDNTAEIVSLYTGRTKKIKWQSGKDKGTYDAMNKGIQLAKGHWLYFLGSDDTLLNKNTLENISLILKSSVAKVVYGNVLIQGNAVWAPDGSIYDGNFDLAKLMVKNICHQAIFYNSEFIKKNGFVYNIKYNVLSDWDFNLKCWAKTSFLYVEQTIAKFNAGGSSTSVSVKDDFGNEFVENFLKYFKISPNNKLTNLLPEGKRKQLIKIKRNRKIINRLKNFAKDLLNR